MLQLGATCKSQICFRDCCGLTAGLISPLLKPIRFKLCREAPSQLVPYPAHCIYLSVFLFLHQAFKEICSLFLALVIGMLVVTGGIWTKWQLFSGYRKISYTLEGTRDLSPSVESLQGESVYLLWYVHHRHECLLFEKKTPTVHGHC